MFHRVWIRAFVCTEKERTRQKEKCIRLILEKRLFCFFLVVIILLLGVHIVPQEPFMRLCINERETLCMFPAVTFFPSVYTSVSCV